MNWRGGDLLTMATSLLSLSTKINEPDSEKQPFL
jgi:hypothetical protein